MEFCADERLLEQLYLELSYRSERKNVTDMCSYSSIRYALPLRKE